jgi:hypothetical protein
MRFRIGGLAGVGTLALVALMPAPASRPLALGAPSAPAQLGISSSSAGTALVRLDPVSLKRSGRSLQLNGFAGVF